MKDLILAALKKLGPSKPRVIADRTGIDPADLKKQLKQLIEEKAVKAAGATSNRLYALPDQDLAGASSTPPPGAQEEGQAPRGRNRQGLAPAGRRAPVPAGIHRRAGHGDRAGRPGPADFLPGADAGHRGSAAQPLRGLT